MSRLKAQIPIFVWLVTHCLETSKLISLEKPQGWGRRGSISSMGCDVFDIADCVKNDREFRMLFPHSWSS